MKLFEVTNGFVGESYVRMLVITETPERAIEIAKPQFANTRTYPQEYWKNLTATEICPDTSQEWYDEVTDG